MEQKKLLVDYVFFIKGHLYGIIGDNCSGKSTLVNLILKLENLLSGDICINDTSINLIDNYSLRKRISLIEQDVVLFNDTLYNNTIYGDEDVSDFKSWTKLGLKFQE